MDDKVRMALIERSGGFCEINRMLPELNIAPHGLDWRSAIHHIEHKKMGCSKRRRARLDKIENLVLLCGHCHDVYGHNLKEKLKTLKEEK